VPWYPLLSAEFEEYLKTVSTAREFTELKEQDVQRRVSMEVVVRNSCGRPPRHRKRVVTGNLLLAAVVLLTAAVTGSPASDCRPTQPDMLGPFYKPDAPARSKVGAGYVLTGTVRSTQGCASVSNAVIEFWLAGPDGRYDDAYRATVRSDTEGAYRFESGFPPPYGGRPPHIHLRVSAPGFRTLVTQHYPRPGVKGDRFDLVLLPGR
jgi:hypothetical protein